MNRFDGRNGTRIRRMNLEKADGLERVPTGNLRGDVAVRTGAGRGGGGLWRLAWGGVLAGWIGCVGATYDHGEEIDLALLPSPAPGEIEFDRDVRPILEISCVRCHGPELARSRFRLDDREAALRGGGIGVAIVPGSSEESPLIHYVSRLVEGLEMPPEGQGDPLTEQQVGVLRAWIDQGAVWSEEPVRRTELRVSPGLQWIGVGGNEAKFREHQWIREGWSGGLLDFEWLERMDAETSLRVRGRGLYDAGDHGVDVLLRRRDLGFIRFGYDLYRRYYDDHGGYAPWAGIDPPPRLGRELGLDIGRAWVDAGLTLPDVPEIVVGYEYRWRDGDRATLHWGRYSAEPGVFQGPAVFPSFKQIDERTHIVKLDARHTLGGWRLEDNFRVEFHEQDNRKVHRGELSTIPIGEHRERYDHFQAANSFRAEKAVRDWLFVSGGHLYMRLEGQGSFRYDVSFVNDFLPPMTAETADGITLEQESHTLNANVLLGPWEGLSLTASAQGERMRRRGFSGLLAGGVGEEFPQRSSFDRWAMDERLGARYDRIPWTVLYAETRWMQEWIDQFEQAGFGLHEDVREFLRETDARSDRRDAGGGFRFSPRPGWSLDGAYWRRYRASRYGHRRDESFESLPNVISGNGYPAFIRRRTIEGDEVDARLIVRLTRAIRMTLRYQLRNTGYDTVTDTAIDTSTGVIHPGGWIQAGRREDHVYGTELTWSPRRRFHGMVGYSYSDSRMRTGVRDVGSVVPYRGDIRSVRARATYLVNDDTELRLSYSVARADFTQDNAPDGLPLGIRYEHHGLLAGVTRRFRENLSTTIQYGYFDYREPTSGRATDYRAHAVLATVTWQLP
jgi:hypothetical protein